MEGLHSSDELWEAAQFGQDRPKVWSADSVECLGQVYEEQVQVLALFNAFFLQLPDGKDHVHSASVLSETILTFRNHAVYWVLSDSVQMVLYYRITLRGYAEPSATEDNALQK